MLEEGHGVGKIAEELEISESTVRRVMKKQNLSTRRDHTLLDLVDTDALLEQYLRWDPIAKILSTHEITRPQLYYILRQTGTVARTKDVNWTEAQANRLAHAIQLYKDGWRISDITQETGIHQPQLHEELARLQIPLRRPHPRRMPSDEEVQQRIADAAQD
jgi:AraC-like DNA-binding protein